MQKERSLTVVSRFRKNKFSETVCPEIRLSGLWLKACGFSTGQKITINYQQGEIIIKKSKETEAVV